MDIARINIHRGMNLIDAFYIARCLGCEVTPRHGTGEVRVQHRAFADLRSVLVNGRKKETPRHLLVLLKRVRDRMVAGNVSASAA